MRRFLVIGTLSFIAATAAAQAPADTPQTRRAAAERYAKVADVPKMTRDMVEAMVPSLPPGIRTDFRSLMLSKDRADAIEAVMVVTMVKHFTTAEMNALADFYGSASGKSAMAKFGAYMGDVMPLMQAEMARAVAEFERQRRKPPGT